MRIARGPLAGVEGILVEVKQHKALVVSISLLQRAVSVEIDSAWVDPVNTCLSNLSCALSAAQRSTCTTTTIVN
jgi:hypothetical protein